MATSNYTEDTRPEYPFQVEVEKQSAAGSSHTYWDRDTNYKSATEAFNAARNFTDADGKNRRVVERVILVEIRP